MPERANFMKSGENVNQPRAFAVSGNNLKIFGHTLPLPEIDGIRVGYFNWDNSGKCAAMLLESRELREKYLLRFRKGKTEIKRGTVEDLTDEELSHGERLEVLYDLIDHIRHNYFGLDPLKMTGKQSKELLAEVAERHDPEVIKSLEKMKAGAFRELLKEAAADLPADELSGQLVLPLDGNYSSNGGDPDSNADPAAKDKAPAVIPDRTPWACFSDLEIIRTAGNYDAEAERTFVLSFKHAEMLGRPKGTDVTLKIPAREDMPLMEGEILNVFNRGEENPLGTFMIDLFDGNAVYGRLRFFEIPREQVNYGRLFARPRRSPRQYLAEAVEDMERRIVKNPGAGYGALGQVIGMIPAQVSWEPQKQPPKQLDESQRRAWNCAVNIKNPVVLVQGPPGTGKTTVLEQVLRSLCRRGQRILVTAPSNTAVDNICRKVFDLPVLRIGLMRESIAPDVADRCWMGERKNMYNFAKSRLNFGEGGVFAGTHVGLLRNDLITEELNAKGMFDAVIFDEAGMSSIDEFLLLCRLAKRVILFGDHRQLRPFPLPQEVLRKLRETFKPMPRHQWKLVTTGALEWLIKTRHFPVLMLQQSYRCQYPRLLRFASTLFYNAGILPSQSAEYYRLPFHERERKFPISTLRLFRTSELPEVAKQERLILLGGKPGLENPAEAVICLTVFYDLLEKYPLDEITIIAPYRRQVALIRRNLNFHRAAAILGKDNLTESEWKQFLHKRISTVDSFQGGESDAVIICYVRSNPGSGIGFVDDPNRINVAHTRCRREMVVVGDLDCLKTQAKNDIFDRLEHALTRDGEIINIKLRKIREMIKDVNFIHRDFNLDKLPTDTSRAAAVLAKIRNQG